MEASMLAVIPGHLFVLVCDESLKRVACPNWECLPFTHLYEPNDPSSRGRLFIGFPVFTIFPDLNCLPLSKGPPSCSKNIMAHAFQCVGVTVGGKVSEQSVYHMCLSIGCLQQRAGQYKGIPDPTAPKTSTPLPLHISIGRALKSIWVSETTGVL